MDWASDVYRAVALAKGGAHLMSSYYHPSSSPSELQTSSRMTGSNSSSRKSASVSGSSVSDSVSEGGFNSLITSSVYYDRMNKAKDIL